jgi:hypothetical protein
MDFPSAPAFLHAPPNSTSSTSRPLRSRATSQSDTSWGINGASKLSISTGPSRGTDTSPGGSSEDRTPSPTPASSGLNKTSTIPGRPAQKASGANQLLLQVPPFRRPSVGEERRRSSTSHVPIRRPQGAGGSTGWSAGSPLPNKPSTRPRSPPWRHSGQPLREVSTDSVEVEDKRTGAGTTRARAGSGGGPGSILSGWQGGGVGEGNVYGFVSPTTTPISPNAGQSQLPTSVSSPSSSRWWNSRSNGAASQHLGQSSTSQPGHKRHSTNPSSMPSSPSIYLASGSGNYFEGSSRGQPPVSSLPNASVAGRHTPLPERRADRRAERVSRITEGFEPDGSPTSPEATTTTRHVSMGKRATEGKKKTGWDVFEEVEREKKTAVSRPPLE